MKGLLFAGTFGVVALLSASAQALPLPSSSRALPSAVSSDVVQIAEGCGRGFHRGPGGRCHRNLSPAQGACWFVRGPAGGWRMVCR